MSVGISAKHGCGVAHVLRCATAAEHASVDDLIDLPRLVERGYYAAVLSGLIQAAEAVEVTLADIPRPLWPEELSPAAVSKRAAIDAESSFLVELTGPRPDSGVACSAAEHMLLTGPLTQAGMLGLVYVYVGSALGGLHLLRVARNAPWWQSGRERLLLRPYGDGLRHRWRTVIDAVDDLETEQTDVAVAAARAGFDLHRRALVDQLSAGGHP